MKSNLPDFYKNIADAVIEAEKKNKFMTIEEARIIHYLTKYMPDIKSILAIKSLNKKQDYDVIMNPQLFKNFDYIELTGLNLFEMKLKKYTTKINVQSQKYDANILPEEKLIYLVMEKSSLQEKPFQL